MFVCVRCFHHSNQASINQPFLACQVLQKNVHACPLHINRNYLFTLKKLLLRSIEYVYGSN
jgi:hypothetical protein